MKIGIIGIDSIKDNDHFALINDALKKDLHGLFSPHLEEIMPICRNYKKKHYSSTNELFEKVDAVYFAGSLKPNFNFALNAIKNSCNLFVEDISELTIEEIKYLFKVALEARTYVQLKLSKSFSSIFIDVKDLIVNPKLIEISKCYKSLIRSSDYFVEILNNLNIANHYFNSGINKASILTVPVEINHYSLVQIRVDYDNGAVLNMRFNNISTEESNNALFYEAEQTFNIDFISNFAIMQQFIKGQITRKEYSKKNENPLKTELTEFINSSENTDLQNISENPPILKIIQKSQEIMDKLFKINNQ
jgi:Oxidoreductase family, NAD-binding Rossmann fold